SYAVHEPLGVVGAIVPWNFPLHMAMWKVAPALAMGNSVVLKPAEQSPMTAIRVAELALEAGLPAGVFNVVPGLGETAGKALALHMDVDMIAFTGSGVVGRLLMQYSGQSNLKRVSLELGGKSPQIIFPDCPDMAAAARSAVWSVFYNQGQVCTAASRLLVHEAIRDEFVEEVVKIAGRIEAGDPLDPATRFGAMVSERQMETALRYIGTAKAEGGDLVLGGGRVRAETGGFYVAPTIFDRVARDATLAREEVFGPLLAVFRAADLDHALGLANDTDYALTAGILSRSPAHIRRAVAELRAGNVYVNRATTGAVVGRQPFGGHGLSGVGSKAGGPDYLLQLLDPRAVSENT
ncbi:MAG: aldehyde dehydrogenase family protein, partial [Acidimicrobiales bacterium]